jgi:hypothetical protein
LFSPSVTFGFQLGQSVISGGDPLLLEVEHGFEHTRFDHQEAFSRESTIAVAFSL